MNGIELSERYYNLFGKPMLEKQFADILPHIAVGIAGQGSDCFGFDDALSHDHDYEAGFCIFTDSVLENDRKALFALERAYAALPKEFEGIKRPNVAPAGGARRGVISMAEFFTKHTGFENGPITAQQFLSVPDYALAEAVNGKIFFDGSGEFTKIQSRIKNMPEDARLKRLAGHLFFMAQSGQYNYERCVKHGESGAAGISAAEFVKNTLAAIHLLNRAYCPFYKWAFKSLRGLNILHELAEPLEFLLSNANDGKDAQDKCLIIEDICAMIIAELKVQGLTDACCDYLEKHAYSVNDKITDISLRFRSIMP